MDLIKAVSNKEEGLTPWNNTTTTLVKQGLLSFY